jgi:serine/threonine protein kinase
MTDSLFLNFGKSVQSHDGTWYRKIEHLGTGGNAVVFLMLATSGNNHGSLFALKMFRRFSILTRRERFMEEINFLIGCNHASITPVYDYGMYSFPGAPNEVFPFMITEYLPVTLDDAIKTGSVKKIDKISYILQVLSALKYLETRQTPIVHRDVKPKNIFINGPSCMLGDFGLIKSVGDVEDDRRLLTESGEATMPFKYRTPDLIRYANGDIEDITPKSDVFQLGLIAAELFTGRNPQITANSIFDPLQMNQVGHIPGKYGRHIKRSIEMMLIDNPDERPSAGELITEWQSDFENVAGDINTLEGRVFRKS